MNNLRLSIHFLRKSSIIFKKMLPNFLIKTCQISISKRQKRATQWLKYAHNHNKILNYAEKNGKKTSWVKQGHGDQTCSRYFSWRQCARLLLLGGLIFTSVIFVSCGSSGGGGSATNTLQKTPQRARNVPAGDYLYCVTNVGQTLTTFNLATKTVFHDPAKVGRKDLVGPWFHQQKGYYISRVDFNGDGDNALFEFNPKTLLETGRKIRFGPNTNPTQLLVVPGTNVGWVLLKGATNDGFQTTGIEQISLTTMTKTKRYELNAELVPQSQRTETLTSPTQLLWDPQCLLNPSGGGCAYLLLSGYQASKPNNRKGWLYAFKPTVSGAPQLIGNGVQLQINPESMLLDRAHLWVVANGGYGTANGYLQKVNLTNQQVTNIDLGLNYSASVIQRFSDDYAWLFSYSTHWGVLDLRSGALQRPSLPNPDPSRPASWTSDKLNGAIWPIAAKAGVSKTRYGYNRQSASDSAAVLVEIGSNPQPSQDSSVAIGRYALNAGAGLSCQRHQLN